MHTKFGINKLANLYFVVGDIKLIMHTKIGIDKLANSYFVVKSFARAFSIFIFFMENFHSGAVVVELAHLLVKQD